MNRFVDEQLAAEVARLNAEIVREILMEARSVGIGDQQSALNTELARLIEAAVARAVDARASTQPQTLTMPPELMRELGEIRRTQQRIELQLAQTGGARPSDVHEEEAPSDFTYTPPTTESVDRATNVTPPPPHADTEAKQRRGHAFRMWGRETASSEIAYEQPGTGAGQIPRHRDAIAKGIAVLILLLVVGGAAWYWWPSDDPVAERGTGPSVTEIETLRLSAQNIRTQLSDIQGSPSFAKLARTPPPGTRIQLQAEERGVLIRKFEATLAQLHQLQSRLAVPALTGAAATLPAEDIEDLERFAMSVQSLDPSGADTIEIPLGNGSVAEATSEPAQILDRLLNDLTNLDQELKQESAKAGSNGG